MAKLYYLASSFHKSPFQKIAGEFNHLRHFLLFLICYKQVPNTRHSDRLETRSSSCMGERQR